MFVGLLFGARDLWEGRLRHHKTWPPLLLLFPQFLQHSQPIQKKTVLKNMLRNFVMMKQIPLVLFVMLF